MKEAEGGAALGSDELERLVWETAAVADPDECARVGALAHEMEPDKYPYTHLTSLTTANYVAGNPLYDILHDGRTKFEGVPLLSLKSLSVGPVDGTAVTEWHVDMPALTATSAYTAMFKPLTAFTGALPNLGSASWLFADTSMTSWRVDLPSLTYVNCAFAKNKLLSSFEGDFSSVYDGN